MDPAVKPRDDDRKTTMQATKTPLRIFFAIEIDETWRIALTKIIKELQQTKSGRSIRWSKPENIHLTVRFIGACTPERLPNLINAVQTTLNNKTTFTLTASKIHWFPSPQTPHVIALNLQPSAGLFSLQHDLDEAVMSCEFSRDNRAYLPHLTLARLNKQKSLLELPKELSLTPLVVDHIILFNSEATANKRVYTALHTFPLKK